MVPMPPMPELTKSGLAAIFFHVVTRAKNVQQKTTGNKSWSITRPKMIFERKRHPYKKDDNDARYDSYHTPLYIIKSVCTPPRETSFQH